MPRVLSLIASATEIVCALGQHHTLVGRSHECDFPSSVKKLPITTEPNFETGGSSKEIDENVKSHLKNGLSIYKVHTDLIHSLKPDVIITQSHCDVCAVSQKDIVKQMGEKLGSHVAIVSLRPNGLADIWTSVTQIAEALDVPARGKQLVGRLKEKLGSIKERTVAADERPTVGCIEWIDPLMAAGNWVPELVELTGGKNLFGEPGKHSPWLTWEQVVKQDPDFLLVMPCGFDMARTRQEMNLLREKKEWLNLKAVQNNQVAILDGNQYLNRPGPRIVESAEMLAEILHSSLFHFGHRGAAWEYAGIV